MGEVRALPASAGGRLTPPAPIRDHHDLSRFSCGKAPLDEWLRSQALVNEGRTARTYVVCAGAAVVGYYCLATGAERRANMPRKIRQGIPDPAPLLIIGRLAVDRSHQGQGIGGGMMKDAFQRILAATAIVGARAVLVHAIDQTAASFYIGYGFIEFPLGSQTMFLPIETLTASL